MTCFRFDIRRRLALYVDGAVTAAQSRSIESHLLDCVSCRAAVVGLRETKVLLRSLPSLDAPDLAMSTLPLHERSAPEPAKPARPKTHLLAHLAADIAAVAMLFAAFAFVYTHAAKAHARFNWSTFRFVPLRQIPRTGEPHVVTEGIVIDQNEEPDERGVRRFKLADPSHRQAFVICEVLNGAGVRIPPTGTRARVYGVTRFDSRPEHQWYEIHPVLKLEIIE
ncbi:MAG TPA: zf-HC2 domain-containing protein [Thermoanaerobaculia bacterium]|nr:zf-HC2 domain-containing protein [Thermoanaerobaculia bacterium]